MPKLYACLISDADRTTLAAVAGTFAHSIEMIEDGVLFDISGLERLIGDPENVSKKILGEIKRRNITGNVAVADTIESAMLLARCESQRVSKDDTSNEKFEQLPLAELDIAEDTLNVFTDLGLKRVEDLLAISEDALIERYGREFEDVIRTIRQEGDRLIVPNVKESSILWSFTLDMAVEDFEQLIFILNHGLDDLLRRVQREGHSTDELDIDLGLANKTKRSYKIKTSFPTLEKAFWLKLINLRVSLDPPEAGILSLDVTARFTKPRPTQKGLYAAKRPEPESLLLTVGKLKKLVGENEVGTPVLLDQRLYKPFVLDAGSLPTGEEQLEITFAPPVIAFNYYRPAVRAEVLIRDQLAFIRTRNFSGHILNSSGVWKSNSKWWDKPWKTREWDIEVENYGIYRLCKVNDGWFLIGEYD